MNRLRPVAILQVLLLSMLPAVAGRSATGSPAAAAGATAASRAPGRSAVLFIGDGMGPAYVTATRVAKGGSAGRLHLDDFPYTALVRTWSATGPVTDSAAAASAYACGQKTVNGVLCEDATAVYDRRDGARLESIARWAKRRGLRVGLVTTTRVTHATPAAFYATDDGRDHERAIARAAIDSGLDFILGGGWRFFGADAPSVATDGWQPSDRDDLVAAARTKGWRVVMTGGELRAVTSLSRPVLGLFDADHLPYEAPAPIAPRPAPTLRDMTRWAIAALRRAGRPFFLMVEGGRIDHAGHESWARTLIDETAAFDAAIGEATRLLDPKSTMVLVTADHETGGLAINGYPEEKDGLLGSVPSEEGATPHPVLTFAGGPGTTAGERGAPYGSADPRPTLFADSAHTGVDVVLYGWGAGAWQVRGTLDNTAVHVLLLDHLSSRASKRSDLTGPPAAVK
jgi:alkaline phosphatase